MRIISGKYKGKRLQAPKNLPVRPTTDMAKEGLFNILNNRYYFEDIKVLDLFSGTGNISYEFASRGTTEILAVDSNSKCIQYIARTSKLLDFSISTIKSDVIKFLKHTDQRFNLIFADPPYHFEMEYFVSIPKLAFDKKLLVEDGLLVVEHASQTDLSSLRHFSESRNYGGSVFSFFEYPNT